MITIIIPIKTYSALKFILRLNLKDQIHGVWFYMLGNRSHIS